MKKTEEKIDSTEIIRFWTVVTVNIVEGLLDVALDELELELSDTDEIGFLYAPSVVVLIQSW